MRKVTTVLFSAIALSSAIAQPQQPMSAADRERAGDILLYRWNKCVMDAADRLAQSTLPIDGVPLVAAKACGEARESWIDSQVYGALTREMAVSAADHAEHCRFAVITEFVDMKRRRAGRDEVLAWSARKRSC
jgi:hypothetical protein